MTKTSITALKYKIRLHQRELRRMRRRRALGLPLPPVSDSTSDTAMSASDSGKGIVAYPSTPSASGSASGSGSDFKPTSGRPSTPIPGHVRQVTTLPPYVRIDAPLARSESASSTPGPCDPGFSPTSPCYSPTPPDYAPVAPARERFLHGVELVAVCSCCEDDSEPSSVTLGSKTTSGDDEDEDSGDGIQLAQEPYDWVVNECDSSDENHSTTDPN